MRGTLRRHLGRVVRGTVLGRSCMEYFPCHVRFSDGVIRSVPRRVKHLFHLWSRSPQLQMENRLACEAYDGGDFIDVGAFHGWYSLLLAPQASKGAQFVSLEPDAGAMPHLLLSLSMVQRYFPSVGVSAINRAAGTGQACERSFPGGREQHPSYRSVDSGGEASSRTVTIDRLVSSLGLTPSFIKVDVEGAEAAVLAGMTETLTLLRSVLMLETHAGWLPEGLTIEEHVFCPLQKLGYSATPLDSRHAIWRHNDLS